LRPAGSLLLRLQRFMPWPSRLFTGRFFVDPDLNLSADASKDQLGADLLNPWARRELRSVDREAALSKNGTQPI